MPPTINLDRLNDTNVVEYCQYMKKNKAPQFITVTGKKLVFGGQCLTHHDDKTVFGWNLLPEEEVNLRVISKSKGIIEGVAEEVSNPSKHRVEPLEGHYMSCSPWQILDHEFERSQKLEIAQETFKKLGGFEIPQLALTGDEHVTGYRNKMEYSFYEGEKGTVDLAFFVRGSRRPQPIQPCVLASDSINKTAQKILDWIRSQGITRFDLKTMIVRSNRAGQTIAGLFVTNQEIKYTELPELDENFIGFQLIYSTHLSPASVITKELKKIGQEFIEENLLESKMSYGLMSFFQINVPVFERTLESISKFIENGDSVIDYYSGVGSITIPLSKKIYSSILVDSNAEAIGFAIQNIELNKISNYLAIASPAEKLLEHLTSDKVFIIDPPRAGLHPDVTKRILEVLPEKIIYLSCNISTQARDVKSLLENYEIIHGELFDYFPRTPHFESLIVLKKLS